ncbi:PREDICTED: RNA-binding protein Musashi homolog 1 [Galeopterus variegatus]|uniref:RNA-binding protein Musashi homolog 1 n=1 Tax=Galeopterus variegatus TaxID=482537 RepID=A0ABM0QGV2_GALVR|nr:PREDICTED: RNA-binding protein Musashi homolog 1 [Galeopterus variegatus]
MRGSGGIGGWAGPPGPAGGSANSARTCGSNFCEAAPEAAGTRLEPSPLQPSSALGFPGPGWAPGGSAGTGRERGGGRPQWRARGQLGAGATGPRRGHRGQRTGEGGRARGPDWSEGGCVVTEGLREYFGQFGEVKECLVMRDPLTKRSRGFGFVTFMDQAGVDKVLAQSRHELDSKTIDPKVAFPRRAQPKMVTRTKKIFVGGLSVNTTVEDVKQYFEQFGKVDDAMLMFDKTTEGLWEPLFLGCGKVPWCLVGPPWQALFQVDDAMLMFDKTTNRHRGRTNRQVSLQVECKKAQPKEVMSPTGSARGRSRVMPYGMDAFMLGIGMLVPMPFLSAIPLTAYGPMAAAAAAAAVVRGTGSHPWTMAPPPGSTPSRTGGFLGTTSPGPMAELYGAANQDSGVSSYISAASPAPSTGFGHSLGGPLIATAFTNGYH